MSTITDAIDALPEAEAARIRAFREKLSLFESQQSRLGIMVICCSLISAALVLFGFLPCSPSFSYWGAVCWNIGAGIIATTLGTFPFWFIYIRPKRQRLQNEIILMMVRDPYIVRDTRAIDPELVHRLRKALIPYGGIQ